MDQTLIIAEINCPWESAALKVKKRACCGVDISLDIMTDAKAIEEEWKSQFRENLSIDPIISASTMLYLPYDATACDEPLPWNKFQPLSYNNPHLVSSFWVFWVFTFSSFLM